MTATVGAKCTAEDESFSIVTTKCGESLCPLRTPRRNVSTLVDTVAGRLERYAEWLLEPVELEEVVGDGDSDPHDPSSRGNSSTAPTSLSRHSLDDSYQYIVAEMGKLEERLKTMRAVGDRAARNHIQVSQCLSPKFTSPGPPRHLGVCKLRSRGSPSARMVACSPGVFRHRDRGTRPGRSRSESVRYGTWRLS